MGKFEKGNPGRQFGTKNKLTKTVKETVLEVFNKLQKDKNHNLKWFAEKYPRDFYAIAAKLIPTEISGGLKHVINVIDEQEKEDSEIFSLPQLENGINGSNS